MRMVGFPHFDQNGDEILKYTRKNDLDKEETILHRIDKDVPYEGRTLNCLEISHMVLIHDHEKTTEVDMF